jgi:hypothetical protein
MAGASLMWVLRRGVPLLSLPFEQAHTSRENSAFRAARQSTALLQLCCFERDRAL